MKSFSRLIFTSVLLTLLFLTATKATAADAAKIMLHDGTAYEDVTYLVDRQYKVVSISKGDWKRTVSFADIAGIFDSDGADVTEDELGMTYPKPVQTAPPAPATLTDSTVKHPDTAHAAPVEPTPAATRLSAPRKPVHPWGIGLRLGTSYSLPATDYYDGFTSGVGFDADLLIPAAPHVAVRLGVSKAGVRDDAKRILRLTYPSFELIEDNVSFRAWRFLVSVAYYDWPRWRQGGRWMYQFYSGLGVIHQTISGEYVVRDPGTQQEGVVKATGGNETKFMLAFGGSAMVKLNNHVGLEGIFEWDGIAIGSNPNSYSYYTAVQYAYIFDFKLGVVWLF